MLSHYGHESGVRVARKHLSWYTKGLAGSAVLRSGLNSLDTANAVKTLISDFYDSLLCKCSCMTANAESTDSIDGDYDSLDSSSSSGVSRVTP